MKHFNLEEFAGGKLSVQLNKALEPEELLKVITIIG